MTIKKDLENRLRGWVPRDYIAVNLQNIVDRHYIRRGIALSLVGMGISEATLWTAFLLGAYKDHDLFLSTQIVIIGIYVLGITVGVWLTKRLFRQTKNVNRGWIPKEVSFPSTVTAQVNQKTSRHNLIIVYVTIFAAVFAAIFVTLGILEVLSLGSYASYVAGAAAAIASVIASVLTIRRNQNPNTSKSRTKQ